MLRSTLVQTGLFTCVPQLVSFPESNVPYISASKLNKKSNQVMCIYMNLTFLMVSTMDSGFSNPLYEDTVLCP